MPTLYLMLGYPGAGKTTASQAIARLTGATHLWADQQRRQLFKQPNYTHKENLELYSQMNQEADRLLAGGKDVIFDTNFNFYKDRAKLRTIAARRGADTKLLWVTTPKAVARRRATADSHRQPTRILGDYSHDEFERQTQRLEPPQPDEPYIAVDGTRITDEYIKELLA